MKGGPRRHVVIPDTQTRPGAPVDHLAWIAEYIKDKKPDVMVHIGDHYDLPSLNSHVTPGGEELEGKRYRDDIAAGQHAWDVLTGPIEAEIARVQKSHKRHWHPEKHVTLGNHEMRASRYGSSNPKMIGTVGVENCTFGDWQVHPFLERVFIDNICYSHYFQSMHSSYPIGGNIWNRIAKIGCSFVAGHEQGKQDGNKPMGNGKTLYGLVAGSCYLHQESYRGAQGQRHWRGIVFLNEVEDGEYDIMPISLRYLCRHYENKPLDQYMKSKYPMGDWTHLA